MSKHTLYICYFALREALVQTQVLPYLRELKKLNDLKVSLLTFEPNSPQNWTSEEISETSDNLASEGISWSFLAYHKTPTVPATIYDVLNGVRFVLNLHRKQKIDVLHARAHIPMLIAMLAQKVTGSQTVFDIRGLVAEEYVDAGIWKEKSKPFQFIKLIEKKGIEKASQIVVLTERMRDFLVERNLKNDAQINVIPCCVDFRRINQPPTAEKTSDRFQLIYAGSVTGLYLLREMGYFFLELKKRRADAFFQILTASPPQFVAETFANLGISESDYKVIKVLPDEVPLHLKKSHLGISFRLPTFSQIAASPTKIPEYLACGLPVVTNDKVGDTTQQIEADQVGAIVSDFTEQNFQAAIEKIEALYKAGNLREKCRKSAQTRFDIEQVGGVRYRNLYEKIFSAERVKKRPSENS